MKKQAIIVCSGGIDSVTAAYYVKRKLNPSKIKILFFNYFQKSLETERKSAKYTAKELKADFKEISVSELATLSSSLINKPGKGKKLTLKDLKNTKKESENWYVPCRNLIFLSYALALAESDFMKSGISSDIFTGFKCDGPEMFSDATPAFVSALNAISKTSCKKPFLIKAPLIKMDKEDIIQLATKLGVKLEKTHSCYLSNKKQCGSCLACASRKAGFYWSGIKDKTKYSN